MVASAGGAAFVGSLICGCVVRLAATGAGGGGMTAGVSNGRREVDDAAPGVVTSRTGAGTGGLAEGSRAGGGVDGADCARASYDAPLIAINRPSAAAIVRAFMARGVAVMDSPSLLEL